MSAQGSLPIVPERCPALPCASGGSRLTCTKQSTWRPRCWAPFDRPGSSLARSTDSTTSAYAATAAAFLATLRALAACIPFLLRGLDESPEEFRERYLCDPERPNDGRSPERSERDHDDRHEREHEDAGEAPQRSIITVTGPSFTSDTCISVRKRPVATTAPA